MAQSNRRRRYWSEHYVPETRTVPGKKKPKTVYRYIGDWFRFTQAKEKLRKTRIALVILQVAVIAVYLFGGMRNSYLNLMMWVAAPSLFSILPLVYEVIGTVQFCTAKEYMTEQNFRDIHSELSVATLIHAALMAVTAVCSVAGCFRIHQWSWLPLIYLLCGVLSFLMRVLFRRVPSCREDNSAHEDE